MAYSTILLNIDEGIATITLNRPEAMNSWTQAMARELGNAMYSLDRDDSVRAVVVTGAGSAFCAGADLSGATAFKLGDTEDEETRRDSLAFPAVMPWQIRKPVIAAINGHAIGVGITYAMNCDIRFVAEDAKIQFAFVRRGITPGTFLPCNRGEGGRSFPCGRPDADRKNDKGTGACRNGSGFRGLARG